MQIELSQKERMLLEDDKKQEEICALKYQNYAQQAKDPELKQLFNKFSAQEQHHHTMIDEMLQGKAPTMTETQSATQQSQSTMQQSQSSTQSSFKEAMGNEDDKVLLSDLLSDEKFVSGVYDTGIFEAANPTVRQALQHIQKEEQHHGEELFNYMHSHGMYKVS